MTQERPSIKNLPNTMNKPQLFCFTYAGGTSTFFDVIEKELESMELVKFEYAGHGIRNREPFYSGFDELADDLFVKFMQAYRGGEYALFGYSMGTISLVEVLRRIMGAGIKTPLCVFLSAHEPHTKAELSDFSDEELDEWVIERTVRFGAIPEKLIHNKTFWRMYLPIYRSDYSMIADYDFGKLDLNSTIPAVVFYSETDTPFQEISLWENYFVGQCEFHEFSGTHFFIFDHHSEMAEIIKAKLVE